MAAQHGRGRISKRGFALNQLDVPAQQEIFNEVILEQGYRILGHL